MEEDTSEIRFIADAMLGRLAKWLRFLGFDTLYYAHIEDNMLVRTALQENRVLLTRDTRLVRVKILKNYILLKANNTEGQIAEIIRRLPPDAFYSSGRCVACNGLLIRIEDKASVRDSVPEYVFIKSESFNRCKECGRVYWEGSHLKYFREKINNILKGNSEIKK